jgi:hypothetical protein
MKICETIILPSITVRVFKNRVPRRIFGPEWDEITTGGLRKL